MRYRFVRIRWDRLLTNLYLLDTQKSYVILAWWSSHGSKYVKYMYPEQIYYEDISRQCKEYLPKVEVDKSYNTIEEFAADYLELLISV